MQAQQLARDSFNNYLKYNPKTAKYMEDTMQFIQKGVDRQSSAFRDTPVGNQIKQKKLNAVQDHLSGELGGK